MSNTNNNEMGDDQEKWTREPFYCGSKTAL